MPKKKPEPPETEPQSERFRRAVRELEADGELNPTADARFDEVLRQATRASPGQGKPPGEAD